MPLFPIRLGLIFTLPRQNIFFPIPSTDLDKAPVYVPFITVLRALKDIAKLKKGETVLIHSGTGAVGHAAIQYAQLVGAKVIATAGNNEKKEYLMGLGVEKCGDSRSLSFVEDVLEWTNGKGVNVILNSLSGDALTKSWSLLAPYGRFVESVKGTLALIILCPWAILIRIPVFLLLTWIEYLLKGRGSSSGYF